MSKIIYTKIQKISVYTAIYSFFFCLLSACILTPPSNLVSQNVLIGKGEASVDAVPDLASFRFSVRFEEKLAADAQSKTTNLVNSVFDLLAKKGIDKKDIRTERFATYPKYQLQQFSQQFSCQNGVCSNPKRILIGYESVQTISVRTRDFALAGEVLSEISQLGVAEVEGLRFEVEDEKKLKQQALDEAIKNAKINAEKTAETLGVKLGKIVNFSDNGYSPIPYLSFGSMARADSGMKSGTMNAEIMPGTQKITSSVMISYEFKSK